MTHKHRVAIFGLILTSVACTGCSSWPASPPAPGQNQLEIRAQGLSFVGPGEVAPGWTTIRLKNLSGMVHFAVLERMPEGFGLEDQQREVAPVFQQGMNLLNAGQPDAAMKEFGKVPGWFNDIVFLGGPGFISAQGTATTTVFLEPGRYLLECYVKTGGIFHSFNADPNIVGMVHEFVVPEREHATVAPQADVRLKVSSHSGIQIEGELRPGKNTVAVEFLDQKLYQHFLGHDVHLARLTAETDLAALADWMNWTLPRGLETPAPAIFVGGVHEMPQGSVGYMHLDLTPGAYAWIAEVPDPAAKNMLVPVQVQ